MGNLRENASRAAEDKDRQALAYYDARSLNDGMSSRRGLVCRPSGRSEIYQQTFCFADEISRLSKES